MGVGVYHLNVDRSNQPVYPYPAPTLLKIGETTMKDILYVNIKDDRKYVLGKDRRNWVWGNGTLGQTPERILSKDNTSYYTSMESMFVNLLEKSFREHVTEFTLANFRESLSKAEQEDAKAKEKRQKVIEKLSASSKAFASSHSLILFFPPL